MFNRADHVKKHFLRIHKGLEYDVKLTKRVKGVDYDVKDAFERNINLNSGTNGSQLNSNSNVNNCNLNVPNLNHVANCNGNVGVFNRTVNVSVNLNGNKSQHQNETENKCFTLFPPHPYIYSNGIHLASNLASLNSLKEEHTFRKESESVSILSNIQANNELSPHFTVVQSNENKLNGESNVYTSVENLSDDSEESEDEYEMSSDYECEYCGCAFVNYPSLHTHRYLLHRHVNDTDAICLYRCVICDRKCITQRAIMKHMLTHSGCRFLGKHGSRNNAHCEQRLHANLTVDELKSKECASCSRSTSSRRKQSQPKKIVKSSINVVQDLFEVEKSVVIKK
ncbi:hypothetical protein B4U80_10130 [Leptotrombidium deliense]|uniref:C2H2-type domain-containing protein n=1 Tax=Leptotrombidium deliense TaxID=299467 RepID=A0A443SJE6_9ACAR|nr:hypothetical protein B4U80_10130 [Leptotrombidium deliense]